MTYNTECSGTPQISQSYTGTSGGYYRIYKGRAWAQRFQATSKCLDFVQFYARNPLSKTVNFHIEVRRDNGSKPMGVPLVNDAGLVSDFVFSYGDFSTTASWVYESIPTILDLNSYYWLCFVPSDFVVSPSYFSTGYERFDIMLTNTTGTTTSLVSAYDSYDYWVSQYTTPMAHVIYKLPTYTVPCTPPVCTFLIS